jgi:glycosyltransferase involved in cell wall biosynthesis
MINAAVITDIPSPYQVELFNAVAADSQVRPQLIYVRRTAPERSWSLVEPQHEHVVLNGNRAQGAVVKRWVESADLVVFSHYTDARVREFIAWRAGLKKPWCFWGERPGARGWGLLGALYRRWRLRHLRGSGIAIWGIGHWAVEGWRSEFGNQRLYFNVPYFSDLNRFARAAQIRGADDGTRRFLFSGSLIHRKGVDVLAEAFLRLEGDYRKVHLSLVGEGELQGWLKTRLKKCGERVRFLGFQDWQDLPKAYADSHILCVPSRYDGWGLVVPEGLAAGLPVIATDQTGAARDLLRPNQNGWIVAAGSVDGLYKAMRQASSLPARALAAVSEAAEKSVAQHSLQHGVRIFADAAVETISAWHP